MTITRTTNRLCLILVILVFGYLGIYGVVKGSIRVGSRGMRSKVIREAEDPIQFWAYAGSGLLLASAGCIALIQSFRIRSGTSDSI